MDHLPLDVRLAFRRLTCSPGFTVVAIVTLALAIGANTITFSALNGFLLRPLPVKRPGELVSLNRGRGVSFSYPAYLDLRDRNRTLAGLIGYRVAPVGMNLGGRTAHVWGYEATGNYFDVLGVHALLGRAITPEDDQRSSPRPVIVLSYDCWQRRFGADPAIVGRVVKVNGLDYTVIGVMGRGFYGTELLYASEFWVPVAMEPQIEPGNPWLDRRFTMNLWVQGRLKTGVSMPQAEADLGAIAAQLGREHREDEGMRIYLSRPGLAGNMLRGPVAGFASVLMGVAGLVLLIACANLANLLLARACTRRKEISVCLAIGAGKWQLIRQLLTESALLCAAGAGAGLGLAAWLLKIMAGWRPPIDIPVNTNLTLDYRVLLFTLAASAATTLLFGLAPAFSAARTDILSALKSQLTLERARWWNTRDALVAAQVALSVILLAGTVLVVRSLQQALTINLGFNPRHAVAVSFDLGLHGYDENRGREFQRRVLERVSALPGIESAALANSIPLSLDQSTTSTYAEGKPVPRPQDTIQPFYYEVTPGYFRTMQTRLVAGRDFTSADRRGGKPVVIINLALAERLFANENALGRRIWGGRAGWTEIVGIVENGKYESLSDDRMTAAVFWPLQQAYNSTMMIVARSALPPAEVTPMLERTAQALDPELAFYQAGSLEDHLRLPLLPARIAAMMLGAFGLLAMVLAATGVYGVMAYAVSRRTREIGIRIAVGATARNVLAIVLRRATVILSCATLAGLVVALAAARYFSPILYGVSPRDPFSYLATVLLVCAVAITACLIPARRAIAVEPSAALREE